MHKPILTITLEPTTEEPFSSILFCIANSLIKPFYPELIIGFVVLVVLLFLSALASGSEMAFFSINRQQLDELKTSNSSINKLISKILEKPKILLATILIANNFVNVGIVMLATFLTLEIFDFSHNPFLGFLIEVIVVSFVILLFGEIIPKVYANKYALNFARLMAPFVKVLIGIFYPLSYLLIKSTSIIDKRIAKRSYNLSIDELSDALDITEDTTTTDDDKKILKGIVKFGNKDVKEIMKSRLDIVAIDFETKFDDVIKQIFEHGFSRLPVYRDNFDTIVGVLYIKDILPHLNQDEYFHWQNLIRTAFFIPESKMISDLLKEFQQKKMHLAIVVDEYGGTSGIVTLEDVIEEIVGEIDDEFDTEDTSYHKIADNKYLFEGKTLLVDFCKVLGIEDSPFEQAKGESDTLAGLILELKGEIPQKNDILFFKNFEFQIIVVDNRRIKKIKVSVHESPTQNN